MAAKKLEFELRVKQREPTLVIPAENTQKGLYCLSNLDQRFTDFMDDLFCYKSQKRSNEDATMVIKDSLARVLVYYYPLAGRLSVTEERKVIVNCTAEGVVFVEAEADCELGEIRDIRNTDPLQIVKLVYNISDVDSILDKPPLAVQVTKFKCGGFILGLTWNHSMFDFFGLLQFMVSWCEIAKGLSISVLPFLDRTILQPRNPPTISYPHYEFASLEDISNTTILYQQEETLERSFLFETMKLERIKKKALEDSVIEKCTTFEALSGFLWQARTKALKLHPDQKIKIHIAVNCRKFFEPLLPKGYFSNVMWPAVSLTTVEELVGKPLSFAVQLIQKALATNNYDYVRSAIDYTESKKPVRSLTGTLIVSSVTRMPFDKIDFGWGAPVQFGVVSLSPAECIMLFPHGKQNESIDALVALPCSAMKNFEGLIDM